VKRLILLAGVLLASCGPILGQPGRGPDGSTLTVAPGAVTFRAGAQEVTGLVLTLHGIGVRVNTPGCSVATSTEIRCALGRVPADRTYELPATGVQVAEADYSAGRQAHHIETD